MVRLENLPLWTLQRDRDSVPMLWEAKVKVGVAKPLPPDHPSMTENAPGYTQGTLVSCSCH